MTANLKEQAFALFLKGVSIRQIVLELPVSRRTLERWSKEGSWVAMRIEAQQRALQEIQNQHWQRHQKHMDRVSMGLEQALRTALAELELFQQGNLTKRQRKFSTRDIANLANACAVMPIRLKTESDDE